MIARYEFDLLTPDEKSQFESHLLVCDACFQDFYEFSPLVNIIRENVSEFQEAVHKKNIVSWMWLSKRIRRLIIHGRRFWSGFNVIPKPMKWIIPIGTAVIVLIFTTYLFLSKSQTRKTGPLDLFTTGEPVKIVTQEPEEMPLKGQIDQYTPQDSMASRLFEIEELLFQGMTIQLNDNKTELIFSWPLLDSVKILKATIFDKEGHKNVYVVDEFKDARFIQPVGHFIGNRAYIWEVEGVFLEMELINVKKEFEIGAEARDSF
jgi:hypothetical protein